MEAKRSFCEYHLTSDVQCKYKLYILILKDFLKDFFKDLNLINQEIVKKKIITPRHEIRNLVEIHFV